MRATLPSGCERRRCAELGPRASEEMNAARRGKAVGPGGPAETSVSREVDLAPFVCERDTGAAHCNAVGIHDAIAPRRRSIDERPQRSVASDRAAVDAASVGKVALRGGHQHVITQE